MFSSFGLTTASAAAMEGRPCEWVGLLPRGVPSALHMRGLIRPLLRPPSWGARLLVQLLRSAFEELVF